MRIEAGAENQGGYFVFRFRVLVGFYSYLGNGCSFFLMLRDRYYYTYCTFSLFFINYTRSLNGCVSYVFFPLRNWLTSG